jgi:hypothetical protein
MCPCPPCETSYDMGWKGMQALRYRRIPATCEVNLFPLPLHAIYLHIRSPEAFSLRFEWLKPARTRRTAARTRNGHPPVTTPD